MAYGEILKSKKGGYYYRYTYNGTGGGLKILNTVYDRFVATGLLDADMIDKTLEGERVTFDEDGNTITMYLKDHINSYNKPTKILAFDGLEGGLDDISIIKSNANMLAQSCISSYESNRIQFDKPASKLKELNLTKSWKTYIYWNSNNVKVDDDEYYYYNTLVVYTGSKKHDSKAKGSVKINIYFAYGILNNVEFFQSFLNEDELNDFIDKVKVKKKEVEKRKAEELEKATEEGKEFYKKNIIDWETKLIEELRVSNNIFNTLTDLTKNVSDISIDISQEVSTYFNYYSALDNNGLNNSIIGEVRHDFEISGQNLDIHDVDIYTNKALKGELETLNDDIEAYKEAVLQKIKAYIPIWQIVSVRTNIYTAYKDNGVEDMIEHIDLNDALDLGYIGELKQLLKTPEKMAIPTIIFSKFTDILDEVQLKEAILYGLKVYIAFHDMPEHDRASVAKYIAIHNMKEYYDEISQYDDTLEILIENSNDKKFKKQILSDIAGTAYADLYIDKESSFYFERRATLKEGTIVYKPVELVEDLRKNYLNEFNLSSDLSILVNIILEGDETLVFQFYSVGTTGEDEAFDGRRLKWLTTLYNRNKDPEHKMYLNYDKDE